ncbi:hypothetical protein DAI22_08g029700 [Oryza sativa Japonica Group]|nr:hypothetical protein DAI22_08g029700 [Oryza sativa Japonica Group]
MARLSPLRPPPSLPKLRLGFSSLLLFPSSPPSLFSPCGFLSREHSTSRSPRFPPPLPSFGWARAGV